MTQSEFSAAKEFKENFFTAAQAMFADSPETQVVFGNPGLNMQSEVVAFLAIASEQEPATLSTQRTRSERLTLEVLVSVFVSGGPESEQPASDRAFELADQLSNYVRKTDTRLGGAVEWCAEIARDSTGQTDPQVLSQGRLIDISITYGAYARLRSS